MRPYPAYNPSGMPWLEQIPVHWTVKPGFSALREKQRKNTGMVEDTVLSLSYGKIVVKPPEKLHGLVPTSFETYQIVEPNDIIIRPTDLQNDWTSLRVGLSPYHGIITSAYLCLKTIEPLTPEYGYLLLHTYDLLKVFYGMGSGLRQNLDFTDLKRIPVLIPPLTEQRTIVAFLDRKLAEIDRYIADKEKLIALLQEQKTALINRAVTRGLNPDVKMKPSGVEWLGEMPEHWEIKRAKHYFREVDERSESGEEELLSVSHITGVTPRSEKEITMFMAESYEGYKTCRVGDLIINIMWAWMGALGVSEYSGIVSSAYGVYRQKAPNFFGKYLDHLLRAKPYVAEFTCRSKGIRSSRLRMYTEDFFGASIVRPPLDEQRKIVEYIESESYRTGQAILAAEREIELINEYRAALIAEAVTGKIDVRGAASPA